ncbi:MAG: MBL fold metallo-hydrolase [Clostridiales bacterium]|jgi:glyoxylase-like metal-dependent hydrolase (beta-lactamase superfamily II)|nr:MBL fold metallo-hydrolase [Clostridiales bacterium]
MPNIFVTTIALTEWQANCYLISNTQTKETIIADPAGDFPKIQKKLAELNLTPIAVFLTHGHFDHIMAAREVCDTYGVKIYAASAEREILSDTSMNLSGMYGKTTALEADIWLDDAQNITLAGFNIRVIATPGHTSGSLCFYFENENILISGDTLFKDGIGTTQLPTGNLPVLARSIKEKLFTLAPETVVYPGHGGKTTIGYESVHSMILNF